MPDSPNFEQIAHHLVSVATAGEIARALYAAAVVEQLRLVWNARGAADLEALRDELPLTQEDVLEETIFALHR